MLPVAGICIVVICFSESCVTISILGIRLRTLGLVFILLCVGVPQLLILLTVDPLLIGCSISVKSVSGRHWHAGHELSEPDSYRCDIYVVM
jgi:hypothetical protein